jgi:hypothetical protein
MKTINYRKIYEQHYGKIPKDEEGRSFQIHHIDGDRSNNNIDNLKCVSIKEHYDIHLSQNDWGACYLLGRKMKISVEELSEHVRNQQYERIANGTHNLLGKNNPVYKRIANGTHNFLKQNKTFETWNKGKTKDTDDRVRKNAESRSKVRYSEETKKAFMKPKSEEGRRNMSIGQKGKKYPKKPCDFCGKEIPTNAMVSHMRIHIGNIHE